MKNSYAKFFSDETGQGITEYGAILAFVSVIAALFLTQASNDWTNGPNHNLMYQIANSFFRIYMKLRTFLGHNFH